MELNLQFGYGMMDHCRSLIRDWMGGTVILSPRDLTEKQLARLSKDLLTIPHGKVLLDPQLYLPRADHERLRSHSYWPSDYATGSFWSGSGLRRLISELRKLNQQIETDAFIAPCILAEVVNSDWLDIQRLILDETVSQVNGARVFATIPLSSDSARSEDQIAQIIEAASDWKVDGFYVVAEHPAGSYLVTDPLWLANVLDLIAGLRLLKRHVLMGYCNHQMLVAATTKVSAIASGTWMNVRSFPPAKFRQAYDEEIKTRTTWYYCPQALSEYTVPYLDIAAKVGVLNLLRPDADMDKSYVEELFTGVQPSAVGFTEQAAFRHYLRCLHEQVSQASLETFDATVTHHEQVLDRAESLLRDLRSHGVRGQLRDFGDSIDANRAALAVLKSTRGAVLRRRWASL